MLLGLYFKRMTLSPFLPLRCPHIDVPPPPFGHDEGGFPHDGKRRSQDHMTPVYVLMYGSPFELDVVLCTNFNTKTEIRYPKGKRSTLYSSSKPDCLDPLFL